MGVNAKLVLAGTIVTGVVVYVAYLGLSSGWQYYLQVYPRRRRTGLYNKPLWA